MRAVVLYVACVVMLSASPLSAQEPPHSPPFDPHHPLHVSPANVGPAATTVQLPTFSFFTISTTVSVPDSGSAYLGGGVGGRTGSRSNGPGLGNRAGGSGIDAGGVYVTAQIQDLGAMDRALLAEAAAARESKVRNAAADAWVARMERARESSAGRPSISVAEARQLRVK
ncbi:MAG: hypothetical protein C0483_09120 [Pirellula sp.]|nr:hypothetical protein [Pirellula sp.]